MAVKKSDDDDIFEFDQDTSEFHFNEEEAPVFAEEKSEKSKKPQSKNLKAFWTKFRKNKIMLVIALLVVLYLIYQVVGLFSGSSSEEVIKPVHVKQVAPVVQVPATIAPTPVPPPPSLQVQGLASDLGSVQSSQKAEADRLTALEQQNQALQQQLSVLKSQAAGNATQLQTVNQELQTVNSDLSTIVKEVAPQPVPVAPATIPTYYVSAVIPGRAWLQSSDGRSITVRPGDEIPHYGRVTSINTDSGTVGTTSGTVFKFGINEQ